MKKAVIICNDADKKVLEHVILAVNEIWRKRGYENILLCISKQKSPDDYMNELTQLDADYLMTFGMAGFEWKALMEQVRYNTLYAKQIHILTGTLPQYEFYLQKEYGIHCFFFTDDERLFEKCKNKYPQLPYLEKYPALHLAEHLSNEEKQINKKI